MKKNYKKIIMWIFGLVLVSTFCSAGAKKSTFMRMGRFFTNHAVTTAKVYTAQAKEKRYTAAAGGALGATLAWGFAGKEDGFIKKIGKVLAGATIGACAALNKKTIFDGVQHIATEIKSSHVKHDLTLEKLQEVADKQEVLKQGLDVLVQEFKGLRKDFSSMSVENKARHEEILKALENKQNLTDKQLKLIIESSRNNGSVLKRFVQRYLGSHEEWYP